MPVYYTQCGTGAAAAIDDAPLLRMPRGAMRACAAFYGAPVYRRLTPFVSCARYGRVIPRLLFDADIADSPTLPRRFAADYAAAHYFRHALHAVAAAVCSLRQSAAARCRCRLPLRCAARADAASAMQRMPRDVCCFATHVIADALRVAAPRLILMLRATRFSR